MNTSERILNAEISRQAAKLAHPLFLINDWTYTMGVPTVDDLEEMIVYLVEFMRSHPKSLEIASGRFVVTRHADDGLEDVLRISVRLYEEPGVEVAD